ncbi:MAG: YpdA family putative bacillithiol disulfide reductase [Gemmatimonadota bacterium]|jgi:thioredoxin reductase (NADPH)|nr:YpdA family putative bacillithiol disulfide reductase [Gemmatimonadota bacterium]
MPESGNTLLDILVIGAGPCGIAVGVSARQRGLNCLLVDRGAVTQAMMEHPTYTTYFSGPEKLEVGGVPFTTAGDKPTRREALRYYRRVVAFHQLDILQYHEVTRVERQDGVFVCQLAGFGGAGESRELRVKNVVIATGYYDNPRMLDVPGANLPKVTSYFTEPYPYFDQDVVVVGGGNSAADAALTCWREGARVTIVHQSGELDKGVKPWIKPDIDNRIAEGAIPALWRHRVREIRVGEVEVECMETGRTQLLKNDWVLSMIGYLPDPRLLLALDVSIDEKTGIPQHDPATMLTNAPGVYLAGVVAAGYDANKIFIENGKLHGDLIVDSVARSLR